MAKTRELSPMLTVKVTDVLLKEFDIACRLRGTNMSARAREWIIDYIEEQKSRYPEPFAEARSKKSRPVKSLASARSASSAYLMSLGTGAAPTRKDELLAAKDIRHAKQIAREHQKKKRRK
jgi:hypothetical protein